MKNKLYNCQEINKFARQINNKEIAETKEILLLQDEFGWSVAHWLVSRTTWSTDDRDILMLQDMHKESVAHLLSDYNLNWTSDIPEIISLTNDRGISVEDLLERRIKEYK